MTKTTTLTKPRRRSTRTTLVAYTHFQRLAKHIRTAEQGQIWNLTKPGVQYLQRSVDAALMALLDVAVATQRSKTLTLRDVTRAFQYWSVYTGGDTENMPPNDRHQLPSNVQFATRFGIKALKQRHPGLIVQLKAARMMQRLYVGLVRLGLAQLVGVATKKRVGPHDVCTFCQRQPCLGLVPPPPPRAPRRRTPTTTTTTPA